MYKFNPKQKFLFPVETVFDLKPLQKYEILFSSLDTSPLQKLYSSTGRTPIPYEALLRSLIYKNIRTLPCISDLVRELHDNPNLAHAFGFNPFNLPCVENFSAFLQDTPNPILQDVKDLLIYELINIGEIKGIYISFDSCNIPSRVKENNLKTSCKDRFDKTKIPKGDKDCRLGVMVHFTNPFQKEIKYFFCYRNFVYSDTLSELPVVERTLPANVVDSVIAIPLLKSLQSKFNFNIHGVISDSALDTEDIISFILHNLHAKPYISHNPRRSGNPNIKVSSKGVRICIAGFEMLSRGKFKDKLQNRIRHKFVCPIIYSQKFREKHPYCPWMHPQFTKGTGCFAYTQVKEKDIRKEINYSSSEFKKIYNLRTSSERVFSRLLNLCMQNPTVYGLNATSFHCTIAHITVLLIALTAVKTGNKDKIRFIKSLVSNI